MSNALVAHSRNIIAEADEIWMHPEGAYCLSPSYGMGRRKRILPNGAIQTDEAVCPQCHKQFEPRHVGAKFCSPVCVTKSRHPQGRK